MYRCSSMQINVYTLYQYKIKDICHILTSYICDLYNTCTQDYLLTLVQFNNYVKFDLIWIKFDFKSMLRDICKSCVLVILLINIFIVTQFITIVRPIHLMV